MLRPMGNYRLPKGKGETFLPLAGSNGSYSKCASSMPAKEDRESNENWVCEDCEKNRVSHACMCASVGDVKAKIEVLLDRSSFPTSRDHADSGVSARLDGRY